MKFSNKHYEKMYHQFVKGGDDFIIECEKRFPNKFYYNKTIYKNSKTKCIFICKEHGEFEKTPNKFLRSKHGCYKCYYDTKFELKKSNEIFLMESKKVHEGRIEPLEKYNSCYQKIKFKCNLCFSVFSQKPSNHLSGNGCPNCKMSKGEIKIEKFLKKQRIKYVKQKMFEGCKGKRRRLPFDFYLPEYNMVIEYDGEQHFKPVNFHGCSKEEAYTSHNKVKYNDSIKNKYCNDNGIKMLRINYKQFNLVESLIGDVICHLENF